MDVVPVVLVDAAAIGHGPPALPGQLARGRHHPARAEHEVARPPERFPADSADWVAYEKAQFAAAVTRISRLLDGTITPHAMKSPDDKWARFVLAQTTSLQSTLDMLTNGWAASQVLLRRLPVGLLPDPRQTLAPAHPAAPTSGRHPQAAPPPP